MWTLHFCKRTVLVKNSSAKYSTVLTHSPQYEEDEVDKELYGSTDSQHEARIATYSFDVTDSLINFSPITQMTVGESPHVSEEYQSKNHTDLEVVTCSG